MKRMTIVLLVLLSITPVLDALQVACPEIVQEVLQSMSEVCAETRRNQVCYGNFSIDSTLHSDAPDIQFEQVGDIAQVAAFQSLRLSPIDAEADQWGVALMQLQASLPNTLPGQNVTFVLFGDVEMTSAVDPDSDANPMQAFYLRTGIGAPGCEEAPSSGLLVNTPKGAGQVEFSMNGMDISLGSTVFLQAAAGESMRVSLLDGAAALRVGEQVIPALEGTRVSIPMGEDLLPEDLPFDIESFDIDMISDLPLGLLDEAEFELAEALADDELVDLLERIDSGDALCGEEGLMDCENIPWILGGTACPLDEDGEAFCELPEFEWGDLGFGEEDYADLSIFDEFFDEFGEIDFDGLDDFDLGDLDLGDGDLGDFDLGDGGLGDFGFGGDDSDDDTSFDDTGDFDDDPILDDPIGTDP